jgi:hypothetical protein
VEWQRRVLALLGRLRRRPPRPATAAPSRVSVPAPPGLKRKLLDRLLLGLRFEAGRWLADREHCCTLFVSARAR